MLTTTTVSFWPPPFYNLNVKKMSAYDGIFLLVYKCFGVLGCIFFPNQMIILSTLYISHEI